MVHENRTWFAPRRVALLLVFFLLVAALPNSPVQAGNAPSPEPDVLTVIAVGDIMMGTDFPEALLPANDGKGIFDGVRDYFNGADILFGNLEGPLTDGGETKKCKTPGKTCYAFRTPSRYVAYLKSAGFTALSIANNHAGDFGGIGLENTLRTLAEAGIQPVGGAAIANSVIRDKKIAIAGFFYFSSPYAYSILDLTEAARIVRELKEKNDIVIVSFHGGAEGSSAQRVTGAGEEYLGENRGNVALFSRAVIDAGADMVLGHGPHVLRALEVYRGKLIAYSLGNFLTYERFNLDGPNGLSVVLRARINSGSGEFLGGEIMPVSLGTRGIPMPDARNRAIRLIQKLTREDIVDPGMMIGDDGILSPRILLQPVSSSPTGTSGS